MSKVKAMSVDFFARLLDAYGAEKILFKPGDNTGDMAFVKDGVKMTKVRIIIVKICNLIRFIKSPCIL